MSKVVLTIPYYDFGLGINNRVVDVRADLELCDAGTFYFDVCWEHLFSYVYILPSSTYLILFV